MKMMKMKMQQADLRADVLHSDLHCEAAGTEKTNSKLADGTEENALHKHLNFLLLLPPHVRRAAGDGGKKI